MNNNIFEWFGGRKVFAGFYASILLSLAAAFLDASFSTYAGSLLLALGITSGSVAYEDARKPSIDNGAH